MKGKRGRPDSLGSFLLLAESRDGPDVPLASLPISPHSRRLVLPVLPTVVGWRKTFPFARPSSPSGTVRGRGRENREGEGGSWTVRPAEKKKSDGS
ncbi:hypothetical protein AKJ62_03525 [candidate division MSBL1 archaeon SCGC-AAA259D14]|uniref:Uncharacterized protein n=2 Tax=candidate division MSBL1 TaxID=215777 RepID=A0A133U4W0_9EURY|nr:hypothetical protein AKJ62_03525 [candidate division MSBL1 archaeon SCGC-AAA259D14]KXA89397.1 hypothetical protein AKJ61_02960 [candidate division MSBL1 archaeon SCGC-AAA259B11]